MSGGIIQLIATGIQDVHLTGNPEISFFRSNYRRHTHFAMSVEEQIIQGTPQGSSMSTVRFERKGDLLSYVYMTAGGTASNIISVDWNTVIDKVELVIGGQVIDTQDVYFSNTISPLYISSTYSTKFQPSAGTSNFFPFQFFFCKDFQSVLPLVALQFHDVEMRIYWKAGLDANRAYRVWSNYIFLDADERKHFAENPQDMIIYQVQRTPVQNEYNQELVFNHPVKFITFPTKTYSDANRTQTLKIQINGVDIGLDRPLPHFTDVNPYYHSQYGFDTATGFRATALIPFCLDTSKLQPTGTLNFSRIDSFRLVTQAQSLSANIIETSRSNFMYAVNYNVLRINKGMAGLLYSN
jgi:hypothetical protein